MKKLVYLFILSIILSCSASKNVRTSKKVIKGSWVLNSVEYNTQNTLSVNLLNDASARCFEGSIWQFIPNNNTGTYSIQNKDCGVSTRNFIFTIQEVNKENGWTDFLIKPTNRKGKSETNKGFRLELVSQSETNMQWQQTVIVNNKPFPIRMNFIKQ